MHVSGLCCCLGLGLCALEAHGASTWVSLAAVGRWECLICMAGRREKHLQSSGNSSAQPSFQLQFQFLSGRFHTILHSVKRKRENAVTKPHIPADLKHRQNSCLPASLFLRGHCFKEVRLKICVSNILTYPCFLWSSASNDAKSSQFCNFQVARHLCIF